MNIGLFACLTPTIIFGFITLVFFILKEKSAMFISGFNSLPKHEQELYDTARLSKDQRNAMFIWTLIMCAGAVLSFYISQYFAIITYVIWLILFLKDVHFDTEKAFGKYKFK